MPLTLDNRFIPAELRDELIPKDRTPMPPKPPEGAPMFMLPEPEMDWKPDLTRQETVIGGVPGLAVTAPGARRDVVFCHIHGGGFTGGNYVTAYRLMDDLARTYNMDSYSVGYTLAPAMKAPGQVEQCVAFYQGLLALGYERIVLGGESAGANLSLAMTLELKRLGLPLPVCVVSASCVADFSGDIRREGPDSSTDHVAVDYLPEGFDLRDVRISPYFGDFTGFPPVLLQAGETESLKADSLALAEKLKDTPVDCTLSIWEAAMHAFGIDPGDTWINRQAKRQIVEYIGKYI